MLNLFGKKKDKPTSSSAAKPRGNDAHNQIQKIKESIETQEKREEHLQRQMDQLLNQAKEKNAKGDKKGAMMLLKRKKMYETQKDNVAAARMNQEQMLIKLDEALGNKDIVDTLKSGKDALQSLQPDPEQVDELVLDLQEQMQDVATISSALATPFGDTALVDEDDLLAELGELDRQDAEELMMQGLPSVPNQKLPSTAPVSKVQNEEDDELARELAAL
jgi:charged multivesicular body protein 4